VGTRVDMRVHKRPRMRYDGHLLLAGAFMNPHTFRLALCGAALLAGCAGTPSTGGKQTLVLEDYVDGAPRDAACLALDDGARARVTNHGFNLVAKEMVVAPLAGAPADAAPRSVYLVPLGSHPVERMARQLDGSFHSVFVNCQTRLAYIAKRGGVIDSIYWFGPFDL